MSIGLWIPIEWADEGFHAYGMWRVAQGELPLADFESLYGPSVFMLGGSLLRIFGEDLSVLRLMILVVKSIVCVLIYFSARQISGRFSAGVAFAIAIILWGIPWPVVTTPYASFFGAALCLAGLLAFLHLRERLFYACVAAGACLGLAATFKYTSGAFAFLACALYLLLETRSGRETAGTTARVAIPWVRWGVLLIATAVSIFYLAPRNPPLNFAVLISPLLFLIGTLGWKELRRTRNSAIELHTFWAWVVLSMCFLLPLAAWMGFYALRGLAGDFLTLSGLPAQMDWFVPLVLPPEVSLLWLGAFACAFGACTLWARDAQRNPPANPWPRRILILVSLLAFARLARLGWLQREDAWWFWASSSLLQMLPFAVVWLAVVEVSRQVLKQRQEEMSRSDRALVLFSAWGALSLLSLYPAADLWHTMPLLPMILPLFGRQLERFWQAAPTALRATKTWRLGAGSVLAALILALTLPAVHDLMRESFSGQVLKNPLPRASGIRGPSGMIGAQTRRAEELIQYLNTPARQEQPVFVFTGEQLFYFLLNRASPFQKSEFTLYLAALGLIPAEQARARVDSTLMIERLRQLKPLLVDEPNRDHTRNLRATFPRVARFLDSHYETTQTYGPYRVSKYHGLPSGTQANARQSAPD